MEVEDGLTGRCAAINADVIAVGMVVFLDDGFCAIKSDEKSCVLLWSRVEPGRSMPSGNQKCMAGGDWVAVPEAEYEPVAEDDAFRRWVAERAACRVRIGAGVALVGMRWSLLSTSGRPEPRVEAGAP
jgi:hypothetical protein